MPEIWLILSLGTAMMHVGTFNSIEACQKAAQATWAQTIGAPAAHEPATVACVQTGTLR